MSSLLASVHEGSITADYMEQQLNRTVHEAFVNCQTNSLKRAHTKMLSSVRQQSATTLAGEHKARLLVRAQGISKARIELLATLKTIRQRLTAGDAGHDNINHSSIGRHRSTVNVFADEPTQSTASYSSLQQSANVVRRTHKDISEAICAADALCYQRLPPLLDGTIPAEEFLLFEPVLGVHDGCTDNSSSPAQRFQLQALGEEAYLSSTILPALNQSMLIQLIDAPTIVASSSGGVTTDNEEEQAACGTSAVEERSTLASMLLGLADRLALRIALDDVRSNEQKICKRRVASMEAPSVAAVTPASSSSAGSDGEDDTVAISQQERRLRWATPPGTLVASPASLPYCVAVVYGAALEASIHSIGLLASLQELYAIAAPSEYPASAATANSDEEQLAVVTPKEQRLDRGVLQFLIQSILEDAARKERLASTVIVEDAQEGRVESVMRDLRGLVRSSSGL